MSINKGKRFGKLTVIKEGAIIQSKSGKKERTWLCKCDCGSVKLARENNLLNGSTKSCGCLRKETGRKNIIKAWTSRQKNFGCSYCGSEKHYAKGLCRNCYNKLRRGTLYKEKLA